MPDRPLSEKINHVVVLMFENRSFDHMLGLLDHPKLPTVLDEPLPNPLDPPTTADLPTTPSSSTATTPSPPTPSMASPM